MAKVTRMLANDNNIVHPVTVQGYSGAKIFAVYVAVISGCLLVWASPVIVWRWWHG